MTLKVYVEKNGQRLRAGNVVRQHSDAGFRFYPWCQRQPSRKSWPTPEAAVKRYLKNFTIVDEPE